MTAARLVGLAAWLGVLLAFRHAYVEPREWAAACNGPGSPAVCVLRAFLLWAQHYGLWGGAALALGVAAFVGAPTAWTAVALGVAGVVNYNASFGVLGAALGAWSWVSCGRAAAARRPPPGSMPPPSTPGTAG